MGKLVVSVRESEGPMDTPWGNNLRRIQGEVSENESAGLRARWEFGRELLAKRQGKKLPPGLLDSIAQEVSVERSELQRRVKFADKFPTEQALLESLQQWPTWNQMIRKGLVTARQAKPKSKPSKYGLLFRQWRKELRNVEASDLSEPDLKVLDAIQEEIARIHDALAEAQNA